MDQRRKKEWREEETEILHTRTKIFDLFPQKKKKKEKTEGKEKPNPFGCLLGSLFFSLVIHLF